MKTESNGAAAGAYHWPSHVSEDYVNLANSWLPIWKSGPANCLPDVHDLSKWRELDEARIELRRPLSEKMRAYYRSDVTEQYLGGVRTLRIEPSVAAPSDRILVHFHGGGYWTGNPESNFAHTCPIAAASGMSVISVDYEKVPFVTVYDIIDQCTSVVEELVADGYAPGSIGFFGLSAGGSLCFQVVSEMRRRGIGVPGAIGPVSALVDFTFDCDTMYTLEGQDPILSRQDYLDKLCRLHGVNDLSDPRISVLYSDMSQPWPPALLSVGVKEILLSDSVRMYQALDQAGHIVKIDPYDAMIHGFNVLAPRTKEAKAYNVKAGNWLGDYLVG